MGWALVSDRHARKLRLMKLIALILVLLAIHVVTIVFAFNSSVSFGHNRLMVVTIVVRLHSILSVVAMAVLMRWLFLLVAMSTVLAARFLVFLSVTMAVSVGRLVRLSLFIVPVRPSLGSLLVLLLFAIFLALFRFGDRRLPLLIFFGQNTLGNEVELPLDLVNIFIDGCSIVVIFTTIREIDRSSVLFTTQVRFAIFALIIVIILVFIFFVIFIVFIV